MFTVNRAPWDGEGALLFNCLQTDYQHDATFLDSCEEQAYNHPFVIAAFG